ncbi:uncharacterized protein [Dysidea avara]|uniref:uncharacterized protein isoform X2 n=1 Tax=Dysidea avara TaxID=196820 RepID=UPI003330DB53
MAAVHNARHDVPEVTKESDRPVHYSTTPQHQVLRDDIAAMLEVENHHISEIRSKMVMLKYNADELEKKLTLLLQELNKYNSEVKSFINRKRSLEAKANQFKRGTKEVQSAHPVIYSKTDNGDSAPVTVSTPLTINNLSTGLDTTSRRNPDTKIPRKLLNQTDLSELRSRYDDIIKNMPDNYYETVQLLERELCDTHISSIFDCSHFTAANQIILECLIEQVTCKSDILDLCESLSLLKNAAQLTSVLDNLRKAVVENLQTVQPQQQQQQQQQKQQQQQQQQSQRQPQQQQQQQQQLDTSGHETASQNPLSNQATSNTPHNNVNATSQSADDDSDETMTSDDVMSRAMGPVNQMGMEQWLSAFTGGAGNSTSSSAESQQFTQAMGSVLSGMMGNLANQSQGESQSADPFTQTMASMFSGMMGNPTDSSQSESQSADPFTQAMGSLFAGMAGNPSNPSQAESQLADPYTQAMGSMFSSVMRNMMNPSNDESDQQSTWMTQLMKQLGLEPIMSTATTAMQSVITENQPASSAEKSINGRGFYAYAEEDKAAALASFNEHYDLMMMMDPDIIKVKLVELKLFPERNSMDSDDPPPECSTQMKLLLKEVKAIILAKGAAKFIDFVEVIVKQEQYDELGNHMIDFYRSSGAVTIPEEMNICVASLSRTALMEFMQFRQRQLDTGTSDTVSIAQKMMNIEWVTLDDIASCGEVRGKRPDLIYIQRLLLKDKGRYWKQIGRELGVDSASLNGIEVKYATHCNKIVSCCYATMKKWLEEDTDATWEKLINALKLIQIDVVYQPPPPLPLYYIQRQSILQTVTDALVVDSSAALTVALIGAGGIGKSTLAKMLCHQPPVQMNFLSGFLWIKLGPVPGKPFNLLSQLYLNLTGLPWTQPETDEEKEVTEEELVTCLSEEIDTLCKNHANKLLVIIDDVWEVEDAKVYIDTFASCKIVLTTRKSDISTTINCKHVIPVKGMDQREAVEFLTIPEFQPLDAASFEQLTELALSVHKSPLLLNLVRGQLGQQHKAMPNRSSASIIKQTFKKLSNCGLAEFDPIEPNLENAINACVRASLVFLNEDDLHRLAKLATTFTFGKVTSKSLLFCIWGRNLEIVDCCCSILQSMGLLSYTSLPTFANTDDTHGIEIHPAIMQYFFESFSESKDVNEVLQKFLLDASFVQQYMQSNLESISMRVDADHCKFYLYNMVDSIIIPIYIKTIPLMLQAIIKLSVEDFPDVSRRLPQVKKETFLTLREKYKKTVTFLNSGHGDQAISYINILLDSYLKLLKELIDIISTSNKVPIATRLQLNYYFSYLKPMPVQIKLYITMRSELYAMVISREDTQKQLEIIQKFGSRYTEVLTPMLQDSMGLYQKFLPEMMSDPNILSTIMQLPLQQSGLDMNDLISAGMSAFSGNTSAAQNCNMS